mmetsp:Transcript_16974/g.46335  ORF Transcript_16974/g.46335 Transcript_16974/m.46335 type:complete len:111 (+) Transcript_16974:78-410(+)
MTRPSTSQQPAQGGQARPAAGRGAVPSPMSRLGAAFKPQANRHAAQGTACMAADRSRTPQPRNDRPKPTSLAKAKTSLQHPWEEHFSDEFGIPYFWNSETGESVWEKPTA